MSDLAYRELLDSLPKVLQIEVKTIQDALGRAWRLPMTGEATRGQMAIFYALVDKLAEERSQS